MVMDKYHMGLDFNQNFIKSLNFSVTMGLSTPGVPQLTSAPQLASITIMGISC